MRVTVLSRSTSVDIQVLLLNYFVDQVYLPRSLAVAV